MIRHVTPDKRFKNIWQQLAANSKKTQSWSQHRQNSDLFSVWLPSDSDNESLTLLLSCHILYCPLSLR